MMAHSICCFSLFCGCFILRFSLHSMRGKAGIRVHEKSIEKFKKRIREITSRKRGIEIEQLLNQLKLYPTGWINYYGIAEMKSKINRLSEWIRRRIRMYLWKQWKKTSAKFRNLQKLGATRHQAWQWANTRKGYWRIAGSWILSTTLTNKYLAQLGYKDIAKRYEVTHSSY
jgi:RNA-directed DNA polymerase